MTERPLPPLSTLAAALAAAVLAAGCPAGPPETEAARAAEREVRDLVAATTPIASTATPAERNRWFHRRREQLARLRAAGPEVGQEALAVLERGLHDEPEVRAALLDVAAHTVPAETVPLLEERVATYGTDEHVRGEAARLLAEVAPERALALLVPVLRDPYADETWPPRESLLEACLIASRSTDHDTGDFDTAELLCDVAIDIHQPDDVRHRAVRELGEERGPRVEKTLEAVLVESTGNAYLRRLAAQSLLRVMEQEEACAVIARVAAHEADHRFLLFLQDVLAKSCP